MTARNSGPAPVSQRTGSSICLPWQAPVVRRRCCHLIHGWILSSLSLCIWLLAFSLCDLKCVYPIHLSSPCITRKTKGRQQNKNNLFLTKFRKKTIRLFPTCMICLNNVSLPGATVKDSEYRDKVCYGHHGIQLPSGK